MVGDQHAFCMQSPAYAPSGCRWAHRDAWTLVDRGFAQLKCCHLCAPSPVSLIVVQGVCAPLPSNAGRFASLCHASEPIAIVVLHSPGSEMMIQNVVAIMITLEYDDV